jgi:pimeloyl-ACP methyl ester carboxylesterase
MKVNFQVTGTGDPTIIFVHGFCCVLADWDAQVARLSPRFKCVALDLPGHGDSPLVQSHSMLSLAEAVNQVKDRVGAERVVLVGHSLGTRVINEAYLLSPQKVIGLVFVDGRFYDGQPNEVAERMKALVDGPGFRAFIERAFTGMFTESSSPELRARTTQRAMRMDAEFGRKIFLESALWDASQGAQKISSISVPVLLLQSSDVDVDRRLISMRPGMRTRYMDVVSERVAEADVKIVAGVGHFTALEAPEVVSHEIEGFIDRCAPIRS